MLASPSTGPAVDDLKSALTDLLCWCKQLQRRPQHGPLLYDLTASWCSALFRRQTLPLRTRTAERCGTKLSWFGREHCCRSPCRLTLSLPLLASERNVLTFPSAYPGQDMIFIGAGSHDISTSVQCATSSLCCCKTLQRRPRIGNFSAPLRAGVLRSSEELQRRMRLDTLLHCDTLRNLRTSSVPCRHFVSHQQVGNTWSAAPDEGINNEKAYDSTCKNRQESTWPRSCLVQLERNWHVDEESTMRFDVQSCSKTVMTWRISSELWRKRITASALTWPYEDIIQNHLNWPTATKPNLHWWDHPWRVVWKHDLNFDGERCCKGSGGPMIDKQYCCLGVFV